MGVTAFLSYFMALVMVMRLDLMSVHSGEEPVFGVLVLEEALLLSVVAKAR